MNLTILGSGCGVPSLERQAPGILLKIDKEPFLFDSGPGTLVRLLKAGVHYSSLNHVFYTHTHSDHSGDLVPFIQALRYTPGYKRTNPLTLYGPIGFSDFLLTLSEAYGKWVISPDFPLLIRELNHDIVSFQNFKIQSLPMQHGKAAIAYRIEKSGEGSIVYSGDTAYNSEIIELAHDANILILECSFTEAQKVEGHLTPREAALIAAKANCQHLILTHFYPPYQELIREIEGTVPNFFSGKLTIAQDFLTLSV